MEKEPISFNEARTKQLVSRKALLVAEVIKIDGELARLATGQKTIAERLDLPNSLIIARVTEQPQLPVHRSWDAWEEL